MTPGTVLHPAQRTLDSDTVAWVHRVSAVRMYL